MKKVNKAIIGVILLPLALITAIIISNIICDRQLKVNASEIEITSLDDLKGATLIAKNETYTYKNDDLETQAYLMLLQYGDFTNTDELLTTTNSIDYYYFMSATQLQVIAGDNTEQLQLYSVEYKNGGETIIFTRTSTDSFTINNSIYNLQLYNIFSEQNITNNSEEVAKYISFINTMYTITKTTITHDVQLIYRTEYQFSDGTNEYIVDYGEYAEGDTITITQDDLNNILKTENISIIGAPDNYIFKGWQYNNTLNNSYTITIDSDNYMIELGSVYQELYNVNMTIKINENTTWQGQFTTIANFINGIINWSNTDASFIELEDVKTNNIALINDKYGRPPQLTNNILTLTQQVFEETNRIIYIQITTSKGTYAINPNSETSHVNLYDLLESENLQDYLNVDRNNYTFNITLRWDEDAPIKVEDKEWEDISAIFEKIADTLQNFLNIKIVFITIGQILLLVLSISILGFIIKIWQGANNG